MTGSPSILAQLVAECDDLDVRLVPTGNNGLIVDAPQGALTAFLTARLKAHKGALRSLLQPSTDLDIDSATGNEPATVDTINNGQLICRCGATTWRDVPIHDGRSIRRDCGRCGRFIEFRVWYGTSAGHYDQHSIG